MASAGLLLLLLMSSSFVLSSLSTQLSSVRQHEHALQKRGEKMQKAGDYIEKIHSVLEPFIGLIPVVGQYLNPLLKAVEMILKGGGDPTAELIKTKFDELNVKIDNYHVEMKWETWATVYYSYETKINVAWKDFKQLIKACKDTKIDKTEKIKRIKLSKDTHKASVLSATKELYTTLTTGQPSFSTGFGKQLSDQFKCHEKSIRDYSLLVNTLFYKGIIVSYFYNSLDEVKSVVADLTKMAFKAASVMFNIHKHCIDNPDQYVIQDVNGLIDGTKDRTQLAKKVRVFLEKEYERYDWMAVAFKTENSKHKGTIAKYFNKHVLEGFIEASVGQVTVAVARQLKGQHTKADKVKTAIEECVKNTDCQNVIEKLKKCDKNVDGTKLSETFSAVHVYIGKSHQSVDAKDAKEAKEAKEAPEEYTDSDDPSSTPYVYKGKCKKGLIFPIGHYRVLIKSDEEIMKKDPCDKLQCGGPGKGKCVVLKNTRVPVCECEKDHFGVGCEKSLEDYKKELMDQAMPSA